MCARTASPIKYNGTVNPQFKGNDVSSAAAEYQNRDNRMNNTLLMPGTKFFDNERSRTAWNDTDFDDSKKYFTAGAPTNASGYAPRKWATERRVADQYESYDYPVIRLAEVYLNYAEAMFELNNRIDNADLKWLNEVRKRVNPNMTELSNELVSANGLSMRDEIRRERTVELFLEGFRIDDLKRWATAPEEMSKDLTGVQITGTWYETGWADHAGRPSMPTAASSSTPTAVRGSRPPSSTSIPSPATSFSSTPPSSRTRAGKPAITFKHNIRITE